MRERSLCARIIGAAYLGVVAVAAGVAIGGSDDRAFLMLIILTLPFGYFVNVASFIFGTSLEFIAPWRGVQAAIVIGGYIAAAAINLAILRSASRSCRLRRFGLRAS
ncbi:SCO4225 family membrane protein [Jatrophihabitans sp. DSM 45814]